MAAARRARLSSAPAGGGLNAGDKGGAFGRRFLQKEQTEAAEQRGVAVHVVQRACRVKDGIRFVCRGRIRPGLKREQTAYGARKVFRPDGFEQPAADAQPRRFGLLFRRYGGGKQQNRQIGGNAGLSPAHGRGHGKAGSVGHPHVKEEQIGLDLPNEGERAGGVRGHVDFRPGAR